MGSFLPSASLESPQQLFAGLLHSGTRYLYPYIKVKGGIVVTGIVHGSAHVQHSLRKTKTLCMSLNSHVPHAHPVSQPAGVQGRERDRESAWVEHTQRECRCGMKLLLFPLGG